MLLTNHVLSGAIVGALSKSAHTAFGAGVASHFFLDAIPHWGARSKRNLLTVAAVDAVLGATTMGLIATKTPPGLRVRVIAGMVGACLPDTTWLSHGVLGTSPFPTAIDDFHARIQTESPQRLPQEVVVATALAAALVATLAARRRRGLSLS